MKRLLIVSLVSLATACAGLYGGGSCPSEDELIPLPVRSGEFSNPIVYDYDAAEPFSEATNIRLVVDRDAATATLSFTTEDGRVVEMDYVATGSQWAY